MYPQHPMAVAGSPAPGTPTQASRGIPNMAKVGSYMAGWGTPVGGATPALPPHLRAPGTPGTPVAPGYGGTPVYPPSASYMGMGVPTPGLTPGYAAAAWPPQKA